MIFLVDKKSRLDIFLAKQILWSRSRIQKLITSNCIKINQKFINKPSFIVEQDQKVEILDSVFVSNKKEEAK
ncbi:MAG: hypothetical protein E7Y34_01415, partial [Mycoplasma sp.]|nr:hypothetical protein [Mycoplasma sp.]